MSIDVFGARINNGDPDGDRRLMRYLDSGYYPINAPLAGYITWRGKLSSMRFSEIKERYKSRSLRQLAKEYGVSYETVRRMIKID